MNRQTTYNLLVLFTLFLIPILLLLELPLWALLLLLFLLLLLLLLFSPPTYRLTDYFIPDQVVISGPPAAINTLMTRLAAQEMPLQELSRLSFDQLDPQVLTCLSDCFDITIDSFVIILYRLTGHEADVAATIRAIQQAAGPGSNINAGPNWLTASPWQIGGSPWQIGGSPWQIGGSPWQIGGSPWQIGGSPWQIGGSTATQEAKAAPAHLFMQQWAWRNINLPVDTAVSGHGIHVGIFDTSPFSDQLAQPAAPYTVATAPEPTPLTIDIQHPIPAAQLPAADGTAADVRNHGLFIAGLIHAVAPTATLHLIRVLGNDNRGDLFTLNQAIFTFLLAHTGANRPQEHLGTVINLSLGIRLLPEDVGLGLPPEAQSLYMLLNAARCLGVVVVAAAGNNSAGLSQPEPANLPANWPSVIGVAASNQQDARACFSNQGNIAAPGGDGRSPTDPTCQPHLDKCSGDCPHALIGPVLDPQYPEGFIYWLGSSFAAPLVSGLAALVMEQGGGKLSPRDVWRIIACGARPTQDPHLGAGIIDITNTLRHCGDDTPK